MFFNVLQQYWEGFLDVLYPEVCVHCSGVLRKEELWLCTHCRTLLPLSPDILEESKELKKRFVLHKEPGFVFSYLRFHKQGIAQSLLHTLKYQNRPELGVLLGNWFAFYLIEQNVWPGVDCILPVPLHVSKLRQRGYNQSLQIAKGLGEVFNTPVKEDLLVRRKASATQTRKNRLERWQNVEDIFELPQPKALEGQSILLVDDVLTTGATLEACMEALYKGGVQKINAAVLAAAQI
jgi:ComF family protein